MIYRSLGTTGLSVSVIGLGCGHLGTQGRRTRRGEIVSLLHQALDRGLTFFDTADIYMGGESERLLGEVLSPHRARVVIATKVGYRPALPAWLVKYARPLRWWAVRRGGMAGGVAANAGRLVRRPDFSAGYLRRAVEASLSRLRTDRIDLLQLHSPSEAVLAGGEALATLERLKQEGKVRFYGLAFATCSDAQAALSADGPISTIQMPISVGDSAAAADVLAWAGRRGIGVIANQPLRKGALLRDGITAEQALGFVTGLPGVATVLVGTTRRSHLEQNVAAVVAGPSSVATSSAMRAESPR